MHQTFAGPVRALARTADQYEARSLVLVRRAREGRRRATGTGGRVRAEPRISKERVDPAEVASVVTEAAAARNGWNAILARCAKTTKPRSALQPAREVIETPSR